MTIIGLRAMSDLPLESAFDEYDITTEGMEKFEDTLKKFETFKKSHAPAQATETSQFRSPCQLSPLVLEKAIYKSFGSCATPTMQSESDNHETIRPAINDDKLALQPRRLRRIKGDIDCTPIVGRVAKDVESHNATPVAAANFAMKPKNLMDFAEEEPTTLNDSLTDMDCGFKAPSSFTVVRKPAKQRRINFDEDCDDKWFESSSKFPTASITKKLQVQIRRQSFLDRKGVTSKPIKARIPLLGIDFIGRKGSTWKA